MGGAPKAVVSELGCAQASASIPSAVRRCTPRPAIGRFADRSRFWRVWMTDVLAGAGDGLREEQGAAAGARSWFKVHEAGMLTAIMRSNEGLLIPRMS